MESENNVVENTSNNNIETEEVVDVIAEYATKLRRKLRYRGFDISDNNDDDVLESKDEIERAIREINRCRRFEPTETELFDLKYENLIIPLSISAFSKMGADGQTRHSENGVVRGYTGGGDYPKDILDSIVPLVK